MPSGSGPSQVAVLMDAQIIVQREFRRTVRGKGFGHAVGAYRRFSVAATSASLLDGLVAGDPASVDANMALSKIATTSKDNGRFIDFS